MIGLLILAAGKSRRYGQDKRFVKMPKGGEILPALIRRGKKAGLTVTVVIDAEDDIAERLDANCVPSRRANGGMGYSIADAVFELIVRETAASEEYVTCESVLIMPSDLPLIRVDSIRQVAAAARQDNIVVPHCAGRRGHPVAFGRRFWPELEKLEGDIGARDIIARHFDAVVHLELEDTGICADGDTPQQMAALFAQMTPP